MDSFLIPVGNGIERRIQTPLQEAVYAVGGGPTRFVDAADIPAHKLEYLLKLDRGVRADSKGRIRSLTDVEDAELIAATTAKLGREVPILELMGLAPWRGPKRSGTDPIVRTKKRQQREEGRTSSRCRGADAALVAAPTNQLYVVRDRMVGTRRA